MRKLKLTLERDSKKYNSTWGDRTRPTSACSYHLLDGRGWNVASFCAQQFHAATGFALKPGETKRVEIEIKEVA